VWGASAVLVVLAAALLLLVQDPRYFFHGDTPSAYLGWEYRLGQQLRAGHWPLVDLHAWASGNAVAEGQWGLFSPLVAAIGLLATVAPNVLVFSTAVKLGLLCVGVFGTFVLARSYGAAAPLAFVAAVAVAGGGMTQYLDLPSWTAGLMIWALLPWVWWALRRTMAGANPAVLLVLVYLLVTVGYVYGTIMLILVLGVCLVEGGVRRDRAAVLRVLGAGVLGGLVACTVYLPPVLTARVTMRNGGGLDLGGKFASDPLALLASLSPTDAVPGTTLHLLPYAYVAWFLPVLVLVDLRALRRRWQPLTGLLLFTAVMALVVVAMPQQIGPLRWPLRLQPFLVQGAVVLTAVLVSRFAVRRPSRRRLGVGLAWLVLASLAVVLRAPGLWPAHLLALAGAAAGFVAVWWCLGRPGATYLRAGALGAAALTVAMGVFQHVVFPVPPSPERNMPALARDYLRPLPAARGDVLVVGDTGTALQADPAWARESLSGSAWYLGRHRVQNGYTTISFRAYRERYCIEFEGSTCPRLLDELFSTEPTTGRRRVDLLAVDTLLLVRADFPDRDLMSPPTGWRVAASTARTVTWVRRSPTGGAARPVWTSPGTSVVARTGDDRSVRFTVRRVPASGGRVVLAALAWPGFGSDVGHLATPVDGYLLTVDVPADAAGRTVTVRYSPPGWHLELATLGLALLGGVAWSGAAAIHRRRRR
jgi:hypothetical protein